MKNRICVVTGGNSGIGKAIVQALARQQAQVVMVSRDRERGETAVQGIHSTVPNAHIDLVVGDLGTIATTRQLAQELLDRYPNIHVLINNAGEAVMRSVSACPGAGGGLAGPSKSG